MFISQQVVLGFGAARLSVRELILEVAYMKKSVREKYINKLESIRNLLENSINPKIRHTLEKWRRENSKT